MVDGIADLLVRPEQAGDGPAVAAVLAAAFDRPDEAALVTRLREAGALAVALVAAREGRVVGHVALSPVTVDGAPGGGAWLGLGPLAVQPEQQGHGVGSALVAAALDAARGMGAVAVFVLGRATFYNRFGFAEASPLGWRCPYPAPSAAFRVQRLDPDRAPPPGIVRYHPAFDDLG